MGRFLNADAFTSTGQGFVGNNMFAYCLNNPVKYCDKTGTIVTESAILSAMAVILEVVAIVIVANLIAITVVELVETISDCFYQPFPVTVEPEATVSEASPHTKNKRPSNRNKHENADARRQRDQGGEKKKQKKGWIPRNYKIRELE